MFNKFIKSEAQSMHSSVGYCKRCYFRGDLIFHVLQHKNIFAGC